MVPIAALALAGCSTINTDQISQYQGSISGAYDAGLISAPVGEHLVYTTGFGPAIDEARKNYSDSQILQGLKDLDYTQDVQARVNSGNAAVSLRQAAGGEGSPRVDTPYDVVINPTGDGAFEVEVIARECASTSKGVQCTTPVSAFIRGQFDVSPPQIRPGTPAGAESGIVVAGNITDGPQGSGIAEARAETCDGTQAANLTPDQSGNAAAVFIPRIGDNCFVVRSSDRAGHSSQSDQIHFTYNMALTGGVQHTADGKFQVTGQAGNTLNAPMQVSLQRCTVDNACADIAAAVPVNQGVFASGGFAPQVGMNNIRAWLSDRFGNKTSADVNITYDFAIAGTAAVQENGKVTVSSSVKNNLYPNFTVTVEKCNDPSTRKQVTVGPDGAANIGDFVPDVGDTCLRETATDPNGVSVNTDLHVPYSFDAGEIHRQINYRDKGAAVYLFGDPPPNVDPATFTASGRQPDWRSFGKTIAFDCSNLGGDVVINGKKWAYALACDLPANAADATISLTFADRNGHSYSAFYPAKSQLIIDLRDHPDPMQLALFLAPYITGLALTGSSAGFGMRKAYKRVDRYERSKRAKNYAELAIRGQVEEADALLREPRRIFKVRADERATYSQLSSCWSDFQHGRYMQALKAIDKVELANSPELVELKRVFVNGIMDGINTQLAQIEQARDASRLSERWVNQLLHQIDEIANTPVWKYVEYQRGRTAQETVSALRLVNQSYSMSAHDFLSRHDRLWKTPNEKMRTGLKRLVALMCGWRNFAAAEEFISHMTAAEKEQFLKIYEREYRHAKKEFCNTIAVATDANLRPKERRAPVIAALHTRMRLTEPQINEFELLCGIELASRDQAYADVFKLSKTLLERHKEDISLIETHLRRAVSQAGSLLAGIVKDKDIARAQDISITRLTTVIAAMSQEQWWHQLPVALRDRVVADAEEIMLVNFARTQPYEVFERMMGPSHMQDRNHLTALIGTLVSWNDLRTPLSCIEGYPVEKDRRELLASYKSQYLDPVRKAFLDAVRSGGKYQYDTYFSRYLVPDAFLGECRGVGEIEMALCARNYAAALDGCDRFVGADNAKLGPVTETMKHLLQSVALTWEPVFQNRQAESLRDNTLRGEALLIGRLKSKAWWKELPFAGKDVLADRADELIVAGMAQTESTDVFTAAMKGSFLASRAGTEKLSLMLCRWRDYQTALACIEAYPQPTQRREMRAAFETTHLHPLRTQFAEALERGYTYDTFFSGFKLPAAFREECQGIGRMTTANRQDNPLGVLQAARNLVLKHPENITLIQGAVEANLQTIAAQWRQIRQTKDRTKLSDQTLMLIADFVIGSAHEPWWEHQLISGVKEELVTAASELKLVQQAQTLPFTGFKRQNEAILADYFAVGKAVATLCDWGDYGVAYECVRTFPKPEDAGRLQDDFRQTRIIPLKAAYLGAMKEDFSASAAFLQPYRFNPAQAKEFAQMRADYQGLQHWKENTVPGWYFRSDYEADPAIKAAIVDDIASTAETVLFTHELPLAAATAVAARWYGIMYYVNGPFVPLFLGISEADIEHARVYNNYQPMLGLIKRSLTIMLNAFDGYSNTVNKAAALHALPLDKQKEMVTAYLIHSRVNEWIMPVIKVLRELPERNIKTIDEHRKEKIVKETYGPIHKLTYTPYEDMPEDEDAANKLLWGNRLWELFNGSVEGVRTDVVKAYRRLKIKPIIKIKSVPYGSGSQPSIELDII